MNKLLIKQLSKLSALFLTLMLLLCSCEKDSDGSPELKPGNMESASIAPGEAAGGAIVTLKLSVHADMNKFFRSLDWIKIVATLAGVETSVSYPAGTSHRNIDKEERDQLGVTEKVVRVSVGIEDSQDIVATLEHALQQSIK